MSIPVEQVIDLKELRIGNYLEYDGKIVHVTMLSMDIDDEYEDQICFCELDKYNNEKGGWNRSICDKLRRIVLTPEILERFGFVDGGSHDGGDSSWKHPEFPFGLTHTKGADGYSLFYFDDNVCVYPAEADFVHQLQNLFFACTGKELNIKL